MEKKKRKKKGIQGKEKSGGTKGGRKILTKASARELPRDSSTRSNREVTRGEAGCGKFVDEKRGRAATTSFEVFDNILFATTKGKIPPRRRQKDGTRACNQKRGGAMHNAIDMKRGDCRYVLSLTNRWTDLF